MSNTEAKEIAARAITCGLLKPAQPSTKAPRVHTPEELERRRQYRMAWMRKKRLECPGYGRKAIA